VDKVVKHNYNNIVVFDYFIHSLYTSIMK